jgi:hypothetical protein
MWNWYCAGAFSASKEETMLRKLALGLAAAGGLGLATMMATPAAAVPSSAPGLQPRIEADVEQVRHRRCHLRQRSRWVRCAPLRRYYRYPYYGPYWGPWGPAPWPFFPFPFFPW